MTDRLYMEHQAGAAPMLPPGTHCDQYLLRKMLSVGGFGQVFEAQTIGREQEKSVVKVEAQTAMFQLLYNECACLKSLNAAYNPKNLAEASPFLRFYGYGTINGFRWLAMEKCGENLNELRKATPLNRFSITTSLYTLSKFVEALQMMHSIGWLHRDVKPANVCVGLHAPRHLYLLDFGMSRVYVEKDGTLKPRRVSAPFRGTLRYVSVNIHRREDASRWDDLWSAFYIATENMVGHLPWRRMGDAKLVEQTKMTADLSRLKYGQERCRPNSLNVLEACLVNSQSDPSFFYQTPPYESILREINSDLRLRGYSLSTVPLDWMAVQYPPTHQYHLMQNPYHNYQHSPSRHRAQQMEQQVNSPRRMATPQKKTKEVQQQPQQRYERSVCFY
uniref:Protein kinase domain-containing protein n=1 Tax=Caenorhabditis japonica TaxID=281687 RepID=A0A8R1DY46_CAEJA